MTTKKEVRRLRTATEMYPIVEQFIKSKQNYAEFSERHDFKPSTLYYWKRKYQRQKAPSASTLSNSAAVFREITPPSPVILPPLGSPLTIRYTNGNCIELAADGSIELIQQLLQLTAPCLP